MLHLIIVTCLGLGITLAVMCLVHTLAEWLAWETDYFDNIWSGADEAEARIAWIITSILFALLLASIMI